MTAPYQNFLCSPIMPSTSPKPSPTMRQSSLLPGQPSFGTSSSASSYLRSYLLPDQPIRSPDLEGQGLKSRSPRTPQTAQFEQPLPVPDHHSYPSRTGSRWRGTEAERSQTKSTPTSHRRTHSSRSARIPDTPATPWNVPSKPLPKAKIALPKPVIRLIVILAALTAVALLLSRTALPSIPKLASRASETVVISPRSGRSRAALPYQPPQTRAAQMMDRAHTPRATRATLPVESHPIPFTHEFLALQSYLLESPHNVIPSHVNPSKPLEGDAILAISPSQLGTPGSAQEAAWLKELEKEREEDVVIWAPAGTGVEVNAILELLGALHYDERTPAIIRMQGRSDLEKLDAILKRLDVDMGKKSMILIANKPISGGKDALEKMKAEGTLQAALQKIGWFDSWKVTEAEHAAKRAKEEEEEAGKDGGKGKKKAIMPIKPRVMNAAFKH